LPGGGPLKKRGKKKDFMGRKLGKKSRLDTNKPKYKFEK